MTDRTNTVARCTPQPAQHATSPADCATATATGTQRTSLKALALLALGRNTAATAHATEAEAARNTGEIQGYRLLRTAREVLLGIADAEGLEESVVDRLGNTDLRELEGASDDTVRAFLRALADTDDRNAGKRPKGYDTPAVCDGCGPVWLWPDICEQSDRREPNGWPAVMSCPWCFRRRAGQLFGRPDVRCQDCRHFVPNERNPRGGFGGCAADDTRGFLPFKSHGCADWRPIDGASSDDE